ncbi:MAG TPA: hypothetical protein VI193_01580 [Acidimicrobiia bacterium]
MGAPPESITCVECGGIAHLISFLPPDDDLEPGTPLAYRCSDCLDRFDVVWEEGDGDVTPE